MASMSPVAWAFVSVLAVSAVSLAGLLTLSVSEQRVRRLATLFVSFAAGALLGDAFLHIIPELFAPGSRQAPMRSAMLILTGIVLFFIVEKLMLHRHHHHDESHVTQPQLAAINILGDAIHNYIDGVLIGASWLVSPEVGVSTTVAVFLHELPQELGDFGVLIHSGLTVRQATLFNVASAAVAILGTATAVAAGAFARDAVTATLLPITAGGFIYIAAANLIPDLQHDRSARALVTQTALIILGISAMAAMTLLD